MPSLIGPSPNGCRYENIVCPAPDKMTAESMKRKTFEDRISVKPWLRTAPRGEYLNPSDYDMIKNPKLPPEIVLPDPLFPTDNLTVLEVYEDAIVSLIIDSTLSVEDRQRDDAAYRKDGECWLQQYKCRESLFPCSPCSTTKDGIILHNPYSEKSFDHHEMTFTLLMRAYRYAMLDLGEKLAPLINQISDGNGFPKRLLRLGQELTPLINQVSEGNGLSKRLLPGYVPKFATNFPDLVEYFLHPRTVARMNAVSDPHLPAKSPHLPSPLLPTADKDLLSLYRDALQTSDDDSKITEQKRRRKERHRQTAVWNWITEDPCYFAAAYCALYNVDYKFARLFDPGFITRHEAKEKELIKKTERLGLADLGRKLKAEIKQGHATREDIDLSRAAFPQSSLI